jgi:GNAT superfamily N-acetyltransferase
VQAYAKDAAAGAAYMAGALDAGRLIGVIEVFVARDGVAEVAFAIDANWRRRGIGSALLEAATRWAEQAVSPRCGWSSRATTGRCANSSRILP